MERYFFRFFSVSLFCALVCGGAFGQGAPWLGDSVIYVNGTWYRGGIDETKGVWATGGAFEGADLGTLTQLTLGAQIQSWPVETDRSQAPKMHFIIDKPTDPNAEVWTDVDMAWSRAEGQNDLWETLLGPGGTFGGQALGTEAWNALADGVHTLEIYFDKPGSAGPLWDSNNSANYKATFRKGGGAAPVVSGLGTCWHCPTNHEPWEDFCMRWPVTPGVGNVMWIRMGNYKQNGEMTGGALHYRYGAEGAWGAWGTEAFRFETNSGDKSENEFWVATNTVPGDAAGKFFQYYMEVTYAGGSGVATTYIYMDPDNSGMYKLTANEGDAVAMPFEVGVKAGSDAMEPGFIWHGGNIVRGGSDAIVQVWAKIGYVAHDGTRWADEAVIRYRIDKETGDGPRVSGVTRVRRDAEGAGVMSWGALTNEVPMTYQGEVEDGSTNGNAMMWMGTIEDAALAEPDSVLIYEIYARKREGGSGNWRQAEYNAGNGACTFQYRMWSDGSGDLTVNGVPADYTTSKFFIDEGDSNDVVEVQIRYQAPSDAEAVEVYTTFGRRDYVDVDENHDGWPDGLIPPDGSEVTADATWAVGKGYWQAVPMALDSGAWTKTLRTDKCGVYRITARYRAKGASTWTWYSEGGTNIIRRDHVVVISPKKALTQTMYELNVLTTKATDTTNEGSGNFEGLSEKLKAGGGPFDEFSLDYLNRLGVNCLWFQPIHPNLEYDRGNTDEGGERFYPGSPYATKNYFSVNREMSVAKTEKAAVNAFTNFVRLCDKAQSDAGGEKRVETINVMLDGVMNHTSWDAIFGEGLAFATNGLGEEAMSELDHAYPGWRDLGATDRIATTGKLGINWYSHRQQDEKNQADPATYWNSVDDNDIASAPERFDFGKWDDVAELLYGDYSTMVRYDDRVAPDYALTDETSRIYSEEDRYYYGAMLPATKLLWKYMASYPEYWIKKTGNDGVNHPGERDAHGVLTDDYGIDGLRCDYAQGLPSQFWEYLINRTRTFKWNFLFMAESLDGGVIGYRSNRQFDILNENMVFRFTQEHVSEPGPFQAALEERRGSYGDGLILLNLTCHDEPLPFGDPQATVSRYAMVSAIDGIPMIYYGQEHGISPLEPESPEINKWKGFYRFEKNFGKWIPHFKKWNKMYVWDDPAYEAGTPNDSRAIAQFYGRINLARQASPALRSKNRWFLNDNGRVMFVAKWEDEGKNPNVQDAVIAAVLFLNEEEGGKEGAAQSYDISAFASKLGIENSEEKFYNIRNLAASDTNAYIWTSPMSGAAIWTNFYIGFDGSEGAAATTWTDNGKVAQYLKIVDVTDYPEPKIDVGAVPTDKMPGEAVSFRVTASGAGNPVVSVAEVSPADTVYTYAGSMLSFTPMASGGYRFQFLARNQYNDRSATTNVSVTILNAAGNEVEIDSIDVAHILVNAEGTTLSFTATCGNLPAGVTVPVYTATEVVDGDWNWTEAGFATISGHTIQITVPFSTSELMVSVGKPKCLD